VPMAVIVSSPRTFEDESGAIIADDEGMADVKTLALNVRRLLHILRVLIAHLAAHLAARHLARWPRLLRRAKLARLPGPVRLRRLFEDAGGGFIKFGQILALQSDLLPLEYCNELFNLLDRLAPFPFADVERVVRSELGRAPAEIFDRFEVEPLSAASIGQVHVAELAGRRVAVKVQRPSADVEFAGDVRLVLLAMALIRRLRLRRFFWVLEPMGDFTASTREELDYRREARYAERLRRNAAGNRFERVPEIFWDLTTRRVLVMEFLPGLTALDHLRAMTTTDAAAADRVRGKDFDRNRFARHIIANFVGDAFQYGVFHADLHPANLLVLPGEAVGYVDFGITGVLSGYSRRHLVALTLAVTRGDVDALADIFLRLARADENSNLPLFRARLAEVAPTWYAGEGAVRMLTKSFTLVFLDMLIMCRETGVLPEHDVIKYIRSSVAADGLISRLAPGFNVGQFVAEHCRQLVGQASWRAALSWDTLNSVLESSVSLAETGASRAATVLHRLADGEVTALVDITTAADRDTRRRRRAIRLAGVVVALVALIDLTAGEMRFGVNIVTVAGALTGLALVMLVDAVRRLARSS
jgi:ubiquinone biosynthesis protein